MSGGPALAILVAAERSGTHYLRSVINRNAAGKAYWEVANAEDQPAAHDDVNFFKFQNTYRLSQNQFFIPNVSNTRKLISEYINFLSNKDNNTTHPIIIDVKYGHIVNFTSGWWDVYSRPLLMDIARENGIPFIHLIRRRLFETVVSNSYARATGVWRTTAAVDTRHTRIRLDRDDLIHQARRLRDTIALCRQWLKSNHAIEIYYEDIMQLPSPSWKRLESILACPITELKSEFAKTTPRYVDVIDNYGDVADLLGMDIDDHF